MHATKLSRLAAMACVALMVAGCANTIRGIGRDAAGTVNATQDAGRNIDRAAR